MHQMGDAVVNKLVLAGTSVLTRVVPATADKNEADNDCSSVNKCEEGQYGGFPAGL